MLSSHMLSYVIIWDHMFWRSYVLKIILVWVIVLRYQFILRLVDHELVSCRTVGSEIIYVGDVIRDYYDVESQFLGAVIRESQIILFWHDVIRDHFKVNCVLMDHFCDVAIRDQFYHGRSDQNKFWSGTVWSEIHWSFRSGTLWLEIILTWNCVFGDHFVGNDVIKDNVFKDWDQRLFWTGTMWGLGIISFWICFDVKLCAWRSF